MIPVTTQQATTTASPGGAFEDIPSERQLGADFRLNDSPNAAPGRPLVDLQINRATLKDLAFVSGIDNLAQAIQLRMWTIQGALPYAPGYGLRRLVGFGMTDADATSLRITARQTLVADRRVQRVTNIRFVVEDDVVDLEANVIPVTATSGTTMRTALI